MKQKQVRLDFAGHNVTQLEVTAQQAGQVIIDEPHEWRDRPVVVGERVLMLVEADRSKIKI